MKSLKKVAGTLCAMLVTFNVAAQSNKSEKSVDQAYLSTVEDVVITELANSDERDNKLVALQYLESAVNEGRATPDMVRAMDQLAGEGISSQARTNGRLMNNYPDIRAKSCELLGKVATEEAKQSLVKVALADNEPMVMTAAIRALGDVGINNGDEVTNTIAWANKRNRVLNPTSSMALEVVIAYEKLSDTVEDKGPMVQELGYIATDYRYVTPVRTRALNLLNKLKSTDGSGKKSNTSTTKADEK